MGDETLMSAYAAALGRHGYGYAMYEAESNKIIKPATCGYLTESGSWTPLFNLADKKQLESLNLTSFDNVQKAPSNKRNWGPKTSTNVTGRQINLKVEGSLVTFDSSTSASSLIHS
jgi:hypothetical protein